MSDSKGKEQHGSAELAADLKVRVCSLIDSFVHGDQKQAQESFEFLLEKAGNLWRRKQAMEGTKSETRDLLGEVLFSRLRRAFREFQDHADSATEIRSAEWVLGMLFAGATLTEFATALDRAMLECARPQDFSFAGRADFISVEEVLQLLSSGKYNGMLGLEKDDNRVDLFIRGGMVIFFDPHHLIRRVLPGHNSMNYREIPVELIQKAEVLKSQHGTPLLVGLAELGFLKEGELPDLVQHLGLEVFFEFLSERGAGTFFYKKLDELPDFVDLYGHPMAVTPILLEGSKKTDDWSAMLKVFPDPGKPVVPVSDMFARIAEMDLSVLEIKLLAMINGDSSPRQLAPSIGLPLFEVYQYLVRYARDGVIIPDGGVESLRDVAFTLEETMERAFEVLEANDDDVARENALEDAFADPFATVDADANAEEPADETFLDILSKADFKDD